MKKHLSESELARDSRFRRNKIEDQNVATQSLLSELEDTDFNAAIVKFQTLQTSLQASMQAASTTLDMNLMDFLK